jgi:hypothetical protein
VDANLAVQPIVKVADQHDNPIVGVVVTASTGNGSAPLRGTLTATTDAGGLAVFTDLGYSKSGEAFAIHFAAGPLFIDSPPLGPLAAGAATQVSVETRGDGSGVNVPAQTITVGRTLTAYGIARDRYGNFVSTAQGTWSLIKKTGSVKDGDLMAATGSPSAVFTGHLIGTALIHISSGSLTSVDSGLITVRAKPSSGGGGGGGGGSSPLPSLQPIGFTSTSSLALSRDGLSAEAVELKTSDGRVTLGIAAGTKLLNSTGSPLSQLILTPLAGTPLSPAFDAILSTYELGPEGANFNPPLNLSIKYGDLPPGADKNTIRIASWDGNVWQSLPGKLDTLSGEVAASVSHFSKYAVVVGLLPPARFTLSDLDLTAARVNPGDTVSIRTEVANVGGLAGTYRIVLKVNNAEVASQEVTLQADQKQLLSFQVQRNEPGNYTVYLNDKRSQFVVAASPVVVLAVPPLESAVPKSGQTSPPASTPTSPSIVSPTTSTSPNQDGQPGTNWLWMFLAGIATVVVLAVVISRRKSDIP